MQRLSRTFGREKPNDPSLITPFPFEIIPHVKEGSANSTRSASYQASEFESSTAAGILSALDSLSVYDVPIREGDECTCACRNNGHWDDIMSLRKGKRSLRRASNGGEDTATLDGTIFTSDSDTLCEPTSPPTDDINSIYKLHPFGKGDISPENILRRLFQECVPGQDNTSLLSKALEYATSEELKKEITRFFHSQCQMTQTIIAAQLSWASAIAGVSSQEAREPTLDLDSGPSVQEKLLKALEQSNQTLIGALEMYRELESPSVKEIFPPSADAEVPPPPSPTPPPSYASPESRASVCFSDDSQHTECGTPRYIRPLPVLPPVINTNQPEPSILEPAVSSPTPAPAPAPARPKSLHAQQNAGSVFLERQRPPLPQGPRLAQSQAQGRVQRWNSTGDSRHSYPPFDASQSRKEVSSFLKPSYRAFSASSPSLQPRRDTEFGSRYVYNGFSTSSPSLVECIEPPDEDQAVIAPNAYTSESDVPLGVAPTGLLGLCPPAPLRVVPQIHLPDLTGKITKEGDYPAGRGGYADVWKCDMRLTMDTDESKVAVKVLQSHVYDHELEGKIEKRIRREISIWQRLKHENVLPLLGTVQHFGRYISLVSPWMENGSLVQYLKECGGDMGMLRRLQLACEVASGLSYLHSSGVVHGDLSGMNVLITEEGKACLCDFGLSSLMLEFHDPTFCTSTIGANARWAAPEIYRISDEDQESVPIATTKSDVYSFGCILLEILSGLIPYYYLARDGQVLLELQNGTKPRRPQAEGGYVTDALWAQITACWAEPAEQRPTAPQLVEFLQDQFNLERRLQRHLG